MKGIRGVVDKNKEVFAGGRSSRHAGWRLEFEVLRKGSRSRPVISAGLSHSAIRLEAENPRAWKREISL